VGAQGAAISKLEINFCGFLLKRFRQRTYPDFGAESQKFYSAFFWPTENSFVNARILLVRVMRTAKKNTLSIDRQVKKIGATELHNSK
jgi:hypothetical protein